MYRSKYFKYMNVYYSNGKKVGFIKDILLDFNEERIIGFCVSSYKILNKNNIVLVEDIISINKNMVVKKLERGKYLSFNDIKHLEVIDIEGVLMGVIEDIIINEGNFRIVAIIISMG
ncbi:PRC-barrel domain-containing protein, partial [Clostridium botulinum]